MGKKSRTYILLIAPVDINRWNGGSESPWLSEPERSFYLAQGHLA